MYRDTCSAAPRDQRPVAQGINEVAPHGLQTGERPGLIDPHEARVSDYIRGKDCCQPPLEALFGSTALDRSGEALRDAALAHVAGQCVDRRLLLRIVNLLGDAFIRDDACVALRQRHEDQHAGATLGMSDAAHNELLERGAVRPRPPHGARHQQES